MADRGRPTEYRDEYNAKVDEYLAQSADENINYVTLDGKAATGYQARVKVHLPTIEGFAAFIGVPRRTVFDWRDRHEEFSHSLEKILIEQQQRLINSGLSGDYNPTIAKLILSANHGMREKADITTDGNALPSPIYGGLSAPPDANSTTPDKTV